MKNDEKILKLKALVKKKEETIGEKVVFNPNTTCSLFYNGERLNLRTLKENELKTILMSMVSLNETANVISSEYDISYDDYRYQDFTLLDWIADVVILIKQKEQRIKIKELKALQQKLDSMLSESKKTELELDEIEQMLNN